MNRIDFCLLVLQNSRIVTDFVVYNGVEYDMRLWDDEKALRDDIGLNNHLDNIEDLDLSLVAWIARNAHVCDGVIEYNNMSYGVTSYGLERLLNSLARGY